ncbi:SpoIIE family protein phosphatase [Streptomyces sp. 150FB]|uniref:SpoIIE family protein phosphatase n=1 Tax=Streptomyces sp. 150FB TaxID=1576605 RepID=UPI00099B3171
MADRGVPSAAVSPPDDWPAHPDRTLALNHMGSFDWDLERGLLHLDQAALEVFDLRPDEFDGRPESLARRIPRSEVVRLRAALAEAIKESAGGYGMYYRIYDREGSVRWIHAQSHIRYDEEERAYRVVGIARNADQELSEAAARIEVDEGRRRLTGVVERTTALLARAGTVQDVIQVLSDEEALGHIRAVSLMLGIVEGGRIRLAAEGRQNSFAPELEYTRVEGQYPMSEVVRTQRPLFITSREEFRTSYPLFWPYVESLPFSSGAYLPLIAQAQPIGVLGILYPRRGEFSDEERNVLVALGSTIGQSLQRAMLFDQEHDLAQGLQQAMLPRSIPDVPRTSIAVRYRAARIGRNIGGDWYDVIPLPGGRVGLTIGDVQGHDTDAAVVMGQLRIVLWAYAAEGHPPATAMARASAFLHELDTERFATCTYVELNLATGTLQIVRAGHLDPLVRRADGSCEWISTSGGLPLGLSADFPGPGGISYPVTVGHLGPGETLLLCTDGLVEQPGTDLGNRLEVLKETVRAGPSDVEKLADRLGEAVGDQGGGDDVALLLLRRDEENPGRG